MNAKVVTSVVATMAVGFFAFFNNLPQRLVKTKSKTVKSQRTTPLKRAEDESFDLFI